MDKNNSKESHLTDQDDRLSEFMFGNKKRQHNLELGNEPLHSNDTTVHQQEKSSVDDWLFGNHRKGNKDISKQNNLTEQPPFEELLKQVNAEKVAENIDNIISTASQFKPLLEKITPVFKKWMK